MDHIFCVRGLCRSEGKLLRWETVDSVGYRSIGENSRTHNLASDLETWMQASQYKLNPDIIRLIIALGNDRPS